MIKYEENISASQQEEKTEAWLQSKDEDQERAQDPRQEKEKGEEAVKCVTGRESVNEDHRTEEEPAVQAGLQGGEKGSRKKGCNILYVPG